jgi:predicted GH43/DUF377 family glycosyl hydrolase
MKKSIVYLSLALFAFYVLFINRCRELPTSVIKQGICVIDKIEEIKLDGYKAFNPGVIDLGERYLLVARQKAESFLHYIGLKIKGKRRNVIVCTELDHNFKQLTKSKLLIPSILDNQKVTDPRLFKHNGRVYMTYCDHSKGGSIQMLAQLEKKKEQWSAPKSIPLSFADADQYYDKELVQRGIEKNWMPFSMNGKAYAVYLLEPDKIVLELNLETGICTLASKEVNELMDQFSPLRGGTPAAFDRESNSFISLYHINYPGRASFTNIKKAVYIAGAYSFTNAMPFKILSKSKGPLYQKQLYQNKTKIVFPTALIRKGEHYLMFYGEDDKRIKVAFINRNKLLKTMKTKDHQELMT